MTDKEHKERRERIAACIIGTAYFDADRLRTSVLQSQSDYDASTARFALRLADALIAEVDKEPSR